MNIFGSFAKTPKDDSRGALSFGAPRDARDWCGLHERKPFQLDVNRVGIQRVLVWGRNEKGETVGIHFNAPEFVSQARALHLVSIGHAKFCGLASD